MDKIQRLLSKMDVIQYGYFTKNNRKITERSNETYKDIAFFWDNCRILQPKETWKHKIGSCWEQSIIAYMELSKLGYWVKCVYVEPSNSNSHMTVFFKDDGKWFRFEHAWTPYKGVHGPYKTIKSGTFEMIDHMKKDDPKAKNFYTTFVNMNKLIGEYNLTAKDLLKIVKSPYASVNWV